MKLKKIKTDENKQYTQIFTEKDTHYILLLWRPTTANIPFLTDLWFRYNIINNHIDHGTSCKCQSIGKDGGDPGDQGGSYHSSYRFYNTWRKTRMFKYNFGKNFAQKVKAFMASSFLCILLILNDYIYTFSFLRILS